MKSKSKYLLLILLLQFLHAVLQIDNLFLYDTNVAECSICVQNVPVQNSITIKIKKDDYNL